MKTRPAHAIARVSRRALIAFAVLATVTCRPAEERVERREASAAEPSAPLVRDGGTLRLGEEIERTMPGGAVVDVYSLPLAAGEFVQIVVRQRGVDVGTTLFDPESTALATADRQIDAFGDEPLIAIAAADGAHDVRVESSASARGGRYTIRLEAQRPATEQDRASVEASAVFQRAQQLRWSGDRAAAVAGYQRALELWRALGDRFWQAETLGLLGYVAHLAGEFEQAMKYRTESAALFASIGDTHSESIARTHMGTLALDTGDPQAAILHYEKALALRRDAGDRYGAVIVQSSLARAHQTLGEYTTALSYYDDALGYYDESLDGLPATQLEQRARIEHNRGVLYRLTGAFPHAIDAFDEAARLWAQLGLARDRATTLHQKGKVLVAMGHRDIARQHFNEALTLRRQLDDRRDQAATLTTLCTLETAERPNEALALCDEALTLLAATEQPRVTARAELSLGDVYRQLHRPSAAATRYRSAVDGFHRIGDRHGEAEALLGVARSLRLAGDLDAARDTANRALEIVDRVRPRAFTEELSYSYFATVHHFFEFQVDVLLDLHRAHPTAGHDAAALEISERAKARSLLDLLQESASAARPQSDGELGARERDLQQRLQQAELHRLQLFDRADADDEERSAAERSVRQILSELDRVRALMRERDPRYAEITEPQMLDVPEIRQLLDDDTLLLELMLGETRSVLWVLGSDRLETFELPSRRALDQLVDRAHRALTQSRQQGTVSHARDRLCKLSHSLLREPIAALDRPRLLIVADGSLAYLPWAALPDPRTLADPNSSDCEGAAPLVVAHEITSLPSASTLPALRRQAGTTSRFRGRLAVVADPVFSIDDDRIQAGAAAPPSRPGNSPRSFGYTRLHFTRREAEAILALAPSDARFEALDFAANKEAILDGALDGYEMVHLATHGVLDAERPSLSAIVLSLVDEQGRPRDGMLYAHELFHVPLRSELAVLSACETALGREVRGEGLVGLARGLMYAGAQRVMLSLWRIDDESTARFMADFYGHLTRGETSPAEALRAAQLDAVERGADPFHWAGFVLQGEYRPWPSTGGSVTR